MICYIYSNKQQHSLEDNVLTSKGAKILFNFLAWDQSVTYLNISGNNLDDSCMEAAADMLRNNCYIEHLLFGEHRGNKITDAGVEIISEAIEGHISLMCVKFSHNRGITDASVPIIEHMILHSCIGKTTSFNFQFIESTSISEEQKVRLTNLLEAPLESRTLPISSKSKSAAKSLIR